MATCEYSTVCDEVDSSGENMYKCSRDAVNEGTYCELHDDSYLDEGDASAVSKALVEEMERSHRLVGFHLPAISLAANMPDLPLYFDRCHFHGMADFSGLCRDATLTFSSCTFEAGANFTRSTFRRVVRFKGIKSGLGTQFDFGQSKFAEMHLVGSVIPQADFLSAELSHAKLLNSRFTGNASLNDAKLTECNFMNLVFEKEAKFVASKFSRCIFKNLSFKTATFESSIFDSKELSVVDTDMSNVSLLRVDFSGVKFTDRTRWDNDHHRSIYDVRMFYSNPTPDSFAGTLGVLRSLRDNHEYHLMYRVAGQFFVQEMEMRRKYSLQGKKLSERPVCHRVFSLTGLYFWVCGYGESLKRAGMWLAVLFGASSIFFALECEMHHKVDAACASLGMFEKASAHLKRTLAAFFPLGGGDLPDYAVRAMAIPLLGTFFIVIRRRLERKLRH